MSQRIQELNAKARASFQKGHLDFAIRFIQEILKVDSSNLAAKELLAYVFGTKGDHSQALRLLKEVVVSPEAPISALYEYGSLLLNSSPKEAIAPLERALQINPRFFEALHDLATAYASLGLRAKAIEKFSTAAEINPNSSELFYNLGLLHDELLNPLKANACYQKSLEIDPEFIQPLINLALNQNQAGNYSEGLRLLEKALQIEPNSEYIFGNYFHTKMQMGYWSEFEPELKKIISKVVDGRRIIHPFHLLSLIDDPELQKKAAEIYSISRRSLYGESQKLGLSPCTKIKVGYFSADFHNHAVTHLTSELFELHDRNQFEIYAFSSSKQEDPQKQRLRNAFDEFIDISDLSDDEAVRLARSMGIHIAVDLGGYTEKARMGVFEKRAAPIQVSYLGYLGTMGATHMDYILADHEVINAQNRQFFYEKVVYLPGCYQINDRKRIISDKQFTRAEFGLPSDAFVFCCFNHSYKITPEVFSSWCNILLRVENSVLWIYESNAYIANNLRHEAELRGVDPCRLVFGRVLPGPEYLARYKLADLFLDTFPYNAGTTASDALMVGLPVLTRSGLSFQSRMAGSILKAINAPELVSHSIAEYEDKAVDLAINKTRLEEIRKKIEANKKSAPLFDSPTTTKNIESAYQKMYERLLTGQPFEDIDISK